MVLALIGFIAIYGIPNLMRAKIRAEMLSQVKTVRQAMGVARINAIKRGQQVGWTLQNINGIATVVAWVDSDNGQDLDNTEQVLGRWKLPANISLTEDTDKRLYRLVSSSGPPGILFLPTGSAVVDDSREVGAGEGGAVLTDLKGNQFRLLVTGGAGTVSEEMWNPVTSRWDATSRNHWRY